jgi:hypothetical protein
VVVGSVVVGSVVVGSVGDGSVVAGWVIGASLPQAAMPAPAIRIRISRRTGVTVVPLVTGRHLGVRPPGVGSREQFHL